MFCERLPETEKSIKCSSVLKKIYIAKLDDDDGERNSETIGIMKRFQEA